MGLSLAALQIQVGEGSPGSKRTWGSRVYDIYDTHVQLLIFIVLYDISLV